LLRRNFSGAAASPNSVPQLKMRHRDLALAAAAWFYPPRLRLLRRDQALFTASLKSVPQPGFMGRDLKIAAAT
jgi:hypothetical protein